MVLEGHEVVLLQVLSDPVGTVGGCKFEIFFQTFAAVLLIALSQTLPVHFLNPGCNRFYLVVYFTVQHRFIIIFHSKNRYTCCASFGNCAFRRWSCCALARPNSQRKP